MSVSSDYYDLDQDNTLGGNNPSILKIPSQKAIKEALDTKQNTLVSGTNIKTINNTSLLGSGNIDIQSGDNVFIATYNDTTYAEILGAFQQDKSIFVRYDDDEFEFLIPLVAVDETNSMAYFSMVGEANLFIISVEPPYLWGTYNAQLGTVKSVNNIQPDSNGNVTLSIPQQVQSNWNETDTTSKAYIQNKPTIPSPVTVDSALSTTSENPVQNKVITGALNGKANDSDVVHKTGNETIAGQKTFTGRMTASGDLLVGNSNTQHEGGQIDFAKCSNSSLKSNIFIDQYDDGLRFFCSNASNQVSMPLQLEFNVGYALGNTPPTSDNSRKLATTAYVQNTVGNIELALNTINSGSST